MSLQWAKSSSMSERVIVDHWSGAQNQCGELLDGELPGRDGGSSCDFCALIKRWEGFFERCPHTGETWSRVEKFDKVLTYFSSCFRFNQAVSFMQLDQRAQSGGLHGAPSSENTQSLWNFGKRLREAPQAKYQPVLNGSFRGSFHNALLCMYVCGDKESLRLVQSRLIDVTAFVSSMVWFWTYASLWVSAREAVNKSRSCVKNDLFVLAHLSDGIRTCCMRNRGSDKRK